MIRWAVYRFSPWMLFWSGLLFGSIWLCTESGLRWLVLMARPQLPPQVLLGDVRGSLLGEISISGVGWDDGATRVYVRTLRWDLRWRDVLARRIHIDGLRVDGVRVRLGPAADAATTAPSTAPLRLPELPRVRLSRVHISDVVIQQAGATASPMFALERLRLRFDHADGRVQLSIPELRQPQLPALSARLDATLEPEAVRLRSLVLGPDAGGELRLRGDIDFPDDFAISLRAELQDMNLGFVAADLPEAINGQWTLAARIPRTGGDPEVDIDALQLQARWREQPLRVDAPRVTVRGRKVAFASTELRWGDAQVAVDGSIEETMSLNFVAKIPDLAQIIPDLAGSIDTSGRLSGTFEAPNLRLDGGAQGLELPGARIGSARWNGRIRLSAGQDSQWQLQAQDIDAGGQRIDTVQMGLQGPRGALRSTITVTGADVALKTALVADLRDFKALRARIDNLYLRYAGIEEWQLESRSTLRQSASGWTLSDTCLERSESATRLCLRASPQKGGQGITAQLQTYGLQSVLRHLGDESTDLRGDLSLSLAAVLPASGGAPRLDGELTTSAITMIGVRDDEPLTLLDLRPGRGIVRYSDAGLVVQLDIPGQRDAGLKVDVQADADGAITAGDIRLRWTELALLTILNPEIVSAQGQLQAAATLSGSLYDQPEVALDVQLTNGEMVLNTPQITLRDIGLQARGDLQTLSLNGALRSADGTLAITGDVNVVERSGKVALKGDNLRVLDSPLGRVDISPDLTVALTPARVNVRGVIDVPLADLHPAELPSAGSDYVAPSRDQVILQDQNSEVLSAQGPLDVYTRIKVRLGRKVEFAGFGLTTGIRGELDLQVEPGKSPRGTGALQLVDGRYKAYGQDLTLERGRILYSGGPLENPGIDLRAFRKPSPDVTVGIQVRGTAPKPQVSLWSDPDMAHTDQLSWLILGRSAQSESTTGEEDAAALQNATLALGLKGSDFLAKRFKGKLGLDELSIGTRPGEDTNQAALVLGKYLNPRLYVSYGIGLFEPIYTFRMRYSISSKWTLQTESGVESGGDVVYTIER
ncbi:MAG: translocation/assembly module TamB domain-containing protein [Oceanococcaceae bacterium]